MYIGHMKPCMYSHTWNTKLKNKTSCCSCVDFSVLAIAPELTRNTCRTATSFAMTSITSHMLSIGSQICVMTGDSFVGFVAGTPLC